MREKRYITKDTLRRIFTKDVSRDFNSILNVVNGNVEYEVVLDESPKFVNICGALVDIVNGDIALGLFPRSEEYICIGNIKDIISKELLNIDKENFPNELDLKYILEVIKLDIRGCGREIVEEISFSLKKRDITTKSKVIALISMLSDDGNDERISHLLEVNRRYKGFPQLVICRRLIEILKNSDRLASLFFKMFSLENDSDAIKMFDGVEINNIQSSFKANFETLFRIYLRYGVDELLLSSLKSYSYFMRDRRALMTQMVECIEYETQKDIGDNISHINSYINVMEALTSGFYHRDASQELYLAYNFMDMMRANGWEQNIIYSIERFRENPNLWNSVMSRLNIDKILKERGLSDIEFFKGVVGCCNVEQKHIDSGAVNGRRAGFKQYGFISLANEQIYNSEKIFCLTFNNLKSKGLNI